MDGMRTKSISSSTYVAFFASAYSSALLTEASVSSEAAATILGLSSTRRETTSKHSSNEEKQVESGCFMVFEEDEEEEEEEVLVDTRRLMVCGLVPLKTTQTASRRQPSLSLSPSLSSLSLLFQLQNSLLFSKTQEKRGLEEEKLERFFSAARRVNLRNGSGAFRPAR